MGGLQVFGFALAGLSLRVGAAPGYQLSQVYVGQDFFEPFRWSFHTAEDPTHGTVEFVSYPTAVQNGLVSAAESRVVMGADATTVIEAPLGSSTDAVPDGGLRGRPSVRIMSRSAYNGGLFVLDLEHMPTGCGVWPAFWMYGEDRDHIWPSWGEFDIIEGAHRANETMTTLHTTPGCTQRSIQEGEQFTGRWKKGMSGAADNCDVGAEGQWGNQGCSQAGPYGSFGTPFNEGGGGTFAAEWDPEGGHFRTWFWPRSQPLPQDLLARRPNPDAWGRPYSYFRLSDQECSKDHFRNMRLVFDITFCGDLGASTFADSCPEIASKMTCEDFVNRNPESFTEAYWSIRGLDVYQDPRQQHVSKSALEEAAALAAAGGTPQQDVPLTDSSLQELAGALGNAADAASGEAQSVFKDALGLIPGEAKGKEAALGRGDTDSAQFRYEAEARSAARAQAKARARAAAATRAEKEAKEAALAAAAAEARLKRAAQAARQPYPAPAASGPFGSGDQQPELTRSGSSSIIMKADRTQVLALAMPSAGQAVAIATALLVLAGVLFVAGGLGHRYRERRRAASLARGLAGVGAVLSADRRSRRYEELPSCQFQAAIAPIAPEGPTELDEHRSGGDPGADAALLAVV